MGAPAKHREPGLAKPRHFNCPSVGGGASPSPGTGRKGTSSGGWPVVGEVETGVVGIASAGIGPGGGCIGLAGVAGPLPGGKPSVRPPADPMPQPFPSRLQLPPKQFVFPTLGYKEADGLFHQACT